MYKRTVILLTGGLLSFHINNTTTVPRDAAGNANDLLNELRSVARDGVAAAFTEYISMSQQVYSTAQKTKGSSTQDILIQCVNDQARKAIIWISYAVDNVTAFFFFPVTKDEKKLLITCAGTDEGCINGVIEEIKTQMDSVPDAIKKQITSDHQKLEDQLSIIQACGKLAKKRAQAASSDLAEDPQAALNVWRGVTMTGLYKAFNFLKSVSEDIDSTTQVTRDSGSGVEFIQCVNDLAIDSIDWVYSGYVSFTDKFLWPIYDAEIKLVACGLSDENCIKVVFREIITGFNSTSDFITREIQIFMYQLVYPDLIDMRSC